MKETANIGQALSVYWEGMKVPQIRKRLLFTLLILIWFRFLAHLPSPGINTTLLRQFFSQNQFFALLDIFSGGTLANFSVIALGLGPYINASVMFQLLGFVFPKIDDLKKEGEYGRQKISQYTRLLTLPLALLQSVGMYFLLRGQGLITDIGWYQIILLAGTMAAGTMILMFLGELINQYGVGNGVSVLIFIGIVARYPVSIFQTMSTGSQSHLFQIMVFLILTIVLVTGIVMVDEAFLKVPISYARRIKDQVGSGGQDSFLPLKVNTAGVMPIIFALSLVMIPSFGAGALAQLPNQRIAVPAQMIASWLRTDGLVYNLFYFILVAVFTYFYTTVVFNPKDVAEDLRKSGGFIPGIRPGKMTQERISFLLSRVTIIGAVFLGTVAVLPSVARQLTNISAIALGGTGILIVVSVILEIHRLLENLVQTWRYDHYL